MDQRSIDESIPTVPQPKNSKKELCSVCITAHFICSLSNTSPMSPVRRKSVYITQRGRLFDIPKPSQINRQGIPSKYGMATPHGNNASSTKCFYYRRQAWSHTVVRDVMEEVEVVTGRSRSLKL